MKTQPSWLKNAYKTTQVYWGKSQSQITRGHHGASNATRYQRHKTATVF